MRLLLPFLVGLLLLACAVPALAKPGASPPHPVSFPNVLGTTLRLTQLLADKDIPAEWKGPELALVERDLDQPDMALLIALNEVQGDKEMKPAERKAWIESNFCPKFDPKGTLEALNTLAADWNAFVKARIPKGEGAFPALRQEALEINRQLQNFVDGDRVSDPPCRIR